MTRDEAVELIRAELPTACNGGCHPDDLMPLSGDEYACVSCGVRIGFEVAAALLTGTVTGEVVEF